jgi:hypothetical protein
MKPNRKKVIQRRNFTWACTTLTLLGCEIDVADDAHFDVLTKTGWKSAATIKELCEIAHDEVVAYHKTGIKRETKAFFPTSY